MVYDVAIVGSGILGLAHALAAAKRGLKVVVIERSPAPRGATARNFGMVWPVGQQAGAPLNLALRSREIWLEVMAQADLWSNPCGSLHLAMSDLEDQVLREFVDQAKNHPYQLEPIDPKDLPKLAPNVKSQNITSALHSKTELCVDPREVVAKLPPFLAETYKVDFHFSTAALRTTEGTITTPNQKIHADHIYICSGQDFETLYPDWYANSGLVRCKLQMMRAEGANWNLGAMLCAGLTLTHYSSFQACPSLPVLKKHFQETMHDYVRYGIHVMASQHGTGEVTLGDSHEYNNHVSPFNQEEIDQLILDYLNQFLDTSGLQIKERWHGVYAKHPTETYLRHTPDPGVEIVTSPGGAGMTLSFGVGEDSLQNLPVPIKA